MKAHISDSPRFDTKQQQVKDMDDHCRKVHAEAVVHAFRMLISVPAEFAGKLSTTHSGEQTSSTQTISGKGPTLS